MPWLRAASWSSSRLIPSTCSAYCDRLGRQGQLGVGLLDHDRVVCRADDRRTGLAGERREQRRQPERVRLVEPRGRLVDEQQRRPRRERTRNRNANLLAGREPRDPLAGALGEPNGDERLVRVAVEPADLLAELDVLARAEERDEAALLRYERDL